MAPPGPVRELTALPQTPLLNLGANKGRKEERKKGKRNDEKVQSKKEGRGGKGEIKKTGKNRGNREGEER